MAGGGAEGGFLRDLNALRLDASANMAAGVFSVSMTGSFL